MNCAEGAVSTAPFSFAFESPLAPAAIRRDDERTGRTAVRFENSMAEASAGGSAARQTPGEGDYPMGQDGRPATGPRCIALVGPFQSGKTSLLEALLAYSGAVQRVGSIDAGTTVGDSSAEARAHGMSVETNVATLDFFGDAYTFVDCPGSVEFLEDMRRALPAVDAAVVVCEPDERKVPALQQILRLLEDQNIPRFLFLNKIDKAEARVRDALEMLQPASRTPLLVRQIPVWENDIITGFIDLALERAFVYREHAESNVVDIAEGERIRQREQRFKMLEKLADHDDELLETLLEDLEPPEGQGVRRSVEGASPGPRRAGPAGLGACAATGCFACSRPCATRRRPPRSPRNAMAMAGAASRPPMC